MTTQEISEIRSTVTEFALRNINPEVKRINDFLDNIYPTEKEFPIKENLMQRYIILYQIMKDDVAHFHFRKKNGELRSAFGTRSSEIIQQYEKTPQSNPSKERTIRGDCVCYFDIEKQAWRSFNVSSLVLVNTNYTI